MSTPLADDELRELRERAQRLNSPIALLELLMDAAESTGWKPLRPKAGGLSPRQTETRLLEREKLLRALLGALREDARTRR